MKSLICRLHPHLSWSCKEIAVNKDTGRYNGQRNIFFNGKPGEQECSCEPMFLVSTDKFNAESDQERLDAIVHFNDILCSIQQAAGTTK